MILYPKFPQKITWENTMAEHVRPSYFPMWYMRGTISKKHHLIITESSLTYLMESNPHLININHSINYIEIIVGQEPKMVWGSKLYVHVTEYDW